MIHSGADGSSDSRQAMQLKYLARLTGYISSSLSSVEDSQNMVTLLESPR